MAKWTTSDIPDQSGRLAVVTGANSGIGLVAARELARAGAHVVMAVRDTARGADAARKVRSAASAASAAEVEVMELDLADLSSVRSFATAFGGGHDGPDLLFNNAGVMALPHRTTALLTSRSGPSWSSPKAAAKERTEDRSARSSSMTSTSAAEAAERTLRAASSPRAVSRTAITTCAPARVSSRAATRPMPLFAPVTTARRPLWSGMSEVFHLAMAKRSPTASRSKPGPVVGRRPASLAGRAATWRSGYAAACKAVYTGSIPVVASTGFAAIPARG